MSKNNYGSILDRPEIINFLFYPRKEAGWHLPDYAMRFDIQTHDGTRIGSRFYLSAPDQPHILFFHGNGEIAEDYDDIGQVYTELDMNFMVVDYRGYGSSQGQPGVASMLNDAHDALQSVQKWLRNENRTGPLWVMGRSLGSASAIELAASYSEVIEGLIIESGFSQTLPLLKRLGIDTDRIGISEEQVFSNSREIFLFSKPTLIIHAQYDQIIPLNHGEELFSQSPATLKKLHVVEGADHNTIMMMAGMGYFDIIRNFIRQAGSLSTG
jgi:uncharacterized protein